MTLVGTAAAAGPGAQGSAPAGRAAPRGAPRLRWPAPRRSHSLAPPCPGPQTPGVLRPGFRGPTLKGRGGRLAGLPTPPCWAQKGHQARTVILPGGPPIKTALADSAGVFSETSAAGGGSGGGARAIVGRGESATCYVSPVHCTSKPVRFPAAECRLDRVAGPRPWGVSGPSSRPARSDH